MHSTTNYLKTIKKFQSQPKLYDKNIKYSNNDLQTNTFLNNRTYT